VGPVLAALVILAPLQRQIPGLRITHVGVLHLQPAGHHALDQQALDRRRVRPGQLGPQQLQLADERFLERQIIAGRGGDQGVLGLPGQVAAQQVHGSGGPGASSAAPRKGFENRISASPGR
jgi:hypothetical protein